MYIGRNFLPIFPFISTQGFPGPHQLQFSRTCCGNAASGPASPESREYTRGWHHGMFQAQVPLPIWHCLWAFNGVNTHSYITISVPQ